MATLLKVPTDELNDYEGVVIFEPCEGQMPDALYNEICHAYPEHKIE